MTPTMIFLAFVFGFHVLGTVYILLHWLLGLSRRQILPPEPSDDLRHKRLQKQAEKYRKKYMSR